MKTNFKVISTNDENIRESGIYTDGKICWVNYGLQSFFPNNPYDPYVDAGQYHRHNKLKEAVLNDKELEGLLAANEYDIYYRNGYVLIIHDELESCVA